MIIDTHAHLTWESFKPDFKEVIKRAYDAGIRTVINVGPDLERSKQVLNLDCSPLVSFATIGLHPHEALNYGSDESIHQNVKRLEEVYSDNQNNLSKQNKIVAIGECGLDHHFSGVDFPVTENQPSEEELKRRQKILFQTQIDLAKKLDLPLVIHSRDAWEDIFLPELSGTGGVFHSFTGDLEQAKKVLDFGYYLGFTNIVTYPKNDELRQIIKGMPLDKILTETDCPFLPPQTKRGQRSEPADVVEVLKVIAEQKNLSLEEVARVTYQNAVDLFQLERKA